MTKLIAYWILPSLLLTGTIMCLAQQKPEAVTVPPVVRVVLPHYPLLPSGGRERGEVVVVLSFGSEGKILDVKSSGGTQGLRHEAEISARKWEFENPPEKFSILFSFVLYKKGEEQCRPSVSFSDPIRVEVCEQIKEIVKISDPPMEDLSKPKNQ